MRPSLRCIFISSILLGVISSQAAFAEKNCRNLQDLYDEAQANEPDKLPAELAEFSNRTDLNQAKICESNDSIYIESADHNVMATHLISAGVFLGYGLLGLDGTLTRLNPQGGYRDHFRITTSYFPEFHGGGLEYGKHIKGSIFFVGANTNLMMSTREPNTYSSGAIVGVSGGKGRISGHAFVGVMTAYQPGLGFETMPQFGAGIRVRLFKK